MHSVVPVSNFLSILNDKNILFIIGRSKVENNIPLLIRDKAKFYNKKYIEIQF